MTDDLFTYAKQPLRFDGDTYEPEHDDIRLTGQISRVWKVMVDGRWRTLAEIAAVTGDPEASISAQLRHLRKERFGEHTIEKQLRGDRKKGLFEYCLLVNPQHEMKYETDETDS